MNTDITINKYLDEISSSAPTPGGGNVSAFSGAMACALGIMVCRLTYSKKKYEQVEAELRNAETELTAAKDQFLQFAEEDNQAFNEVMAAFKLPKETDDQKKERGSRIEEATLGAAAVPSEVISLCRKAAPVINKIAETGNTNSLSDAGVAASLLYTAVQGAYLNVLINCSSLSNQILGSEIIKKNDVLLEETKGICENIISTIKSKLLK